MYATGHEKLKQIHQKAVFNPNKESIPEVHETKVTCCTQSWNGKGINVQIKVRVSPASEKKISSSQWEMKI